MGTHSVVLVRHSDFPKIIAKTKFGEDLWHARSGRTFKNGLFEYVGEVHSTESLPVFHYNGLVWAPRVKKVNERMEQCNDQPPEEFCLLDISGDFVSLLLDSKKVGKHVIETIESFTPRPDHQSVYVEPYAQAIAIVNIFTSNDVGISVLEGNCSWVVGNEETPSWARASRQNHAHTREVLELILALKQGVKVNLTAKKYQDLAMYF